MTRDTGRQLVFTKLVKQFQPVRVERATFDEFKPEMVDHGEKTGFLWLD